MPREDILSGLKTAISRGESLRQAMLSFYNAGYPKQEIEEAARAIKAETSEQKMSTSQQQIKTTSKKFQLKKPAQKISSYGKTEQTIEQPIQQEQTQPQKISDYEQKPKKSKKGIIILSIILLILVGVLVGFFIFKDAIVEFFNNLFN